jgi:hypothetical protein
LDEYKITDGLTIHLVKGKGGAATASQPPVGDSAPAGLGAGAGAGLGAGVPPAFG